MTSANSLMINNKHTDDVTVDYWEWWKLSNAEKEYFTTNHAYYGSRPTIVALKSWKDIPIPSILINDITPQYQILDSWAGTSRVGRHTGFELTRWLTLTLKEELISPKRAYFLRIPEADNYFPIISDQERTYISFFRWRKIIFMLGSINNIEKINDADLRCVYAWFESQAPPPNLQYLDVKIDTTRQYAHQTWLQTLFKGIEVPLGVPDEAAVHLKLPAKIKGFQYIHRGYAQLYAITDSIISRLHPDYQDSDRYEQDYIWENSYCIVVNLADLTNDSILSAIRIIGRRFHMDVQAPHPHISASGECCWGDYNRTLISLLTARDIVGIFHTVQNFCRIIDPESQLEAFPEIREAYAICELCDSEIDEDDTYTCEYLSCRRIICPDCSEYHECCERRLCKDCQDITGNVYCSFCSITCCDDHSSSCSICEIYYCQDCLDYCENCEENFCKKCGGTCLCCEGRFCHSETCSHMILKRSTWPHKETKLIVCNDCWNDVEQTIYFCAHCKRPVIEKPPYLSPDPLHQCAFCDLVICEKCVSAQLVNNQFFLVQSKEERQILSIDSICDHCFKDFFNHMTKYLDKIGSKFIRDYPIEEYFKDRARTWLRSQTCICGRKLTREEVRLCQNRFCENTMCKECENLCEDCLAYICNDCMRLCHSCEEFTCKDCATQIGRKRWHCPTCEDEDL